MPEEQNNIDLGYKYPDSLLEEYDVEREKILTLGEDLKVGDKAILKEDGKVYKIRPKLQTIKLDHVIYHSLKNRYLTNSRIKDFLKCKKYFYELHISGTRKKKQSDVMKIGSAVDAWLTRGKDEFLRNFIGVTRRNVKNPPAGITELTMSQYDQVVGMCEVLENQPAYLELSDHNAQQIISVDMPIGEHFCGLSGIPDWYKIEGEKCIITDLKTSNNTNEKKHHYKCMDMGYYMQFAVMTVILRKTHPEIKEFEYRHLVIDKGTDKSEGDTEEDSTSTLNIPYVFKLDNERVEIYINILLNEIIPMIAAEKEFLPKRIEWKNAVTVGSLDADFDE